MRVKHIINLHKGSTFPFILVLMFIYDNFTAGPWVYLSLHGTYGILWLAKDQIFPDKQWDKEIPLLLALVGFLVLSLYWIAPFILISGQSTPSWPLMSSAVTLNIIGTFLHFSSDAQKYYTLKYRRGLITEGFFARCRNTNYLGEILIYTSFAILPMHWLPFVILAGFIIVIFIPNMFKKDRSLARYLDFESYKRNSGLLVPKLFVVGLKASQGSSH
ncbi:hypothetical protein OMCYN_01823 [cyanobiont of Ornithocercus magnificus]|nr:hypothetical protein OMCYN_01823 [cyanobiont of Ornithocercus magnificus]